MINFFLIRKTILFWILIILQNALSETAICKDPVADTVRITVFPEVYEIAFMLPIPEILKQPFGVIPDMIQLFKLTD